MYSTIVSTDLLASRLGDWAIVDCRFDLQNEQWGRDQYRSAHIPGAVYASLNDDLSGARTGANGRHPLPAIDALAATLGRLGIDRTTQVIAYDQDAGSYASRLWWLLRYLGHDAVAVLDGGWAKWVREGRPTRGGDESRPPVTFAAAARPAMSVDIADMVSRVNDGTSLLIDARAADRFEGRSETIDRVAGHIPGAINHFFKTNLSGDGTFLPECCNDRAQKSLDHSTGSLIRDLPRRLPQSCGQLRGSFEQAAAKRLVQHDSLAVGGECELFASRGIARETNSFHGPGKPHQAPFVAERKFGQLKRERSRFLRGQLIETRDFNDAGFRNASAGGCPEQPQLDALGAFRKLPAEFSFEMVTGRKLAASG
jgi:thiosulfate/3-mercaptopyruvate sulfurtransferase